MLYKTELERMKNDVEKRKKLVFNSIKITVLLLAVSLVAMVVSLCISVALYDGDGGGRGDKTPPVIKFNGSEDNVIYAVLGETVSYRKYVSVTDNGDGETELKIDNSNVNLSAAGVYNVIYTATDEAGNSAKLTVKVVVKKAEFSYDSLMAKIEELVSYLGISADMSAEEKVKRVFAYVNSPTKNKNEANIEFVNESNSARTDWKTDWVEEAYLTLQRGSGDCYSYYSVSKAFFEYFGIENKGIQRSEGVRDDGTHFWLMVNIGSSSAPKWYYYDATRLAHSFATGSGCLFTEAQLQNYNTNINIGFYSFNNSGYPQVSNNTVNENYIWN